MPKFWSLRPNEHFEEINVVQNRISFVFSKFWAINAGTLPKNFWMRSLNWQSYIQGIKFYHISWCSMTHFVSSRLLAEVFWRVHRNCFLWVLRIVLKEKVLSKKEDFFQRVSDLEREKFSIPANKISRNAKILIASPKRTFWGNQSCSE